MQRNDFCPDAEAAFVRAAREGVPDAVEKLTQRLARVRRILEQRNARMGNPLSAEELGDVAQDTCVVVLRRLGDYRPLAPLEAWIYGICCLQLRDAVRRRTQHRAAVSGALDTDAVPSPEVEPLADQAEVEVLLQRLGGIAADVVRLKHLEDLTFDEVGQRLQMPANTAKTHYYRGMLKLRRLLGAESEAADGEA